MQCKYGFGKTVNFGFDDAIARVTQALQAEGFGVLSDIDVKATMKKSSTATCRPTGFSARAIRRWRIA